ncbi:MAG: YdcF family protein [Chrysiogenales bacterium]
MKRPRVKRILAVYFIVIGIVASVFVIWMAAGWPIGFDRWLFESQAPRKADYIVCLAGGMGGANIPTEAGWERIYTAAQLWLDGYAPKIVFTGGGQGNISEAEVYAGFARWFGCPEAALFFEPGATVTAEHPMKLLEQGALGIRKGTPLIIVTSLLHSRRVAMVFRKAGFTDFRVVTGWSARTSRDPVKVRTLMTSKFVDFRPSVKDYSDVLNQLKRQTAYFFNALREVVAIVVYKFKGKV